MSARGLLQAAVVARLSDALGIAVFDAPPVRRALPFAVAEEPVLADWSTKSWTGREGRLAIAIADGGERPTRLRDLSETAERAIEGMAGEIGEGWRIVAVRLVRGRLVRDGESRWRATSEFAVRLYRSS